MSLADLSIRRPTFISCLVLALIAVGLLSLRRLGVDLFPDVTFPVVTVTTPYPGAAPKEIETLISKPLEDEISTLSGIKKVRSINQEGVSIVVAEFTLETDIKYAEQQIRDRVGSTKRFLPRDIKEPTIRRVDPADQPILILALKAKTAHEGKLFDVADQVIKPRLEQVSQVGLVEVIGGRKREIHIDLDRRLLKNHELSAMQVASRVGAAGQNIPVGKYDEKKVETVYRTMGEFNDLLDIRKTVLNFFGNDRPVTVDDVGVVVDSLEDEKSRAFVNGQRSLFLYVFKQSGSNTIAVVDAVKKQVEKLNLDLSQTEEAPIISLVRDGAVYIRANVTDVKESIYIGILLTIFVVFYFLGNARSTLITGLALPNSLIGAFILMAAFGFTINIMTLLALSLSVGLLIDDAIVVRENIFRHLEMGKSPLQAASEGTAEVRLAVIATTLTVISVFGPIAFLKGVTGQFFKQFGLTICFAMAISLFDALTMAPMLSAYFAGRVGSHGVGTNSVDTSASLWSKVIFWRWIRSSVKAFDRFQSYLEESYTKILQWILNRPKTTLFLSFLIFVGSCSSVSKIPKTFLPPPDNGEFVVSLDLPPGSNLNSMTEEAKKVDQLLKTHPEIELTAVTIGNREGEVNVADIYVHLVHSSKRSVNTTTVKELVRKDLVPMSYLNPKVKDYDAVGGGMRPFMLNIMDTDADRLEAYSKKVFQYLKNDPHLKDVDMVYKPGKPEFRIVPDQRASQSLGLSTIQLGQELRTQIEGDTSAKFRENGLEYDIRIRLKEDQRNLKEGFVETYVPNINYSLIRLRDVAKPVDTTGPAKITRMDRNRYIEINGEVTPGAGLGNIMDDLVQHFKTDLKPPTGVRYAFAGQAENLTELIESMLLAIGLAILFIYLILASLYESFVLPLTIMVALPLALCGSLVALFITQQSLNIFSMIGIIMLLGVATKNSILLVDYANQLVAQGRTLSESIIEAGRTRLRPILMTTMALVAGTIPIALGLNEASRQRTSMGISIIGGLVSSTLLTLVVVPAIYSGMSRFRDRSKNFMKRLVS